MMTDQHEASLWEVATLGELCSKPQYGWTTRASAAGTVKYLRTTDITRGSVDWATVPYCEEVPADVEKFLLVEGDIVISRAGSVGVSRLIRHPQKAVFASYLIRFRPNKRVSPEYLSYFLQSPDYWRQVKANAVGIALQNLNASKLSEFAVPVPSLSVQAKITSDLDEQFSRLDAATEALNRAQANLKRYRASVLKAACEGRLVQTEAELAAVEGRGYDSGAIFVSRNLLDLRAMWSGRCKYVEPPNPSTDNLRSLPEGWCYASLTQLGELNRGKSKHRPRNDPRLYGGPHPFVQTGDIRKSGGSVQNYSQTYSDLGLTQSRLWPAGTLCITIAANIAETGILAIQACFPDSVVGFIGPNETVTRYVHCFVQTAREDLAAYAPATAQKNINLEILQQIAVPLPPLAEQERIVAEVERRLSVANALEGSIPAIQRRASSLQQAILQRAFSAPEEREL